ncbi:hypothetical protein HYS30_01215, partial [Candidatus Peregrinibacteria bacterium]|nr:hypothetical protein [Candidatus Peregrinibacteria bacterium]
MSKHCLHSPARIFALLQQKACGWICGYLKRRRNAPAWQKAISWLVIFAVVAMQMPYLTALLPVPVQKIIAPVAQAASVTWDGGGGVDTNWNTCANWSADTCPTSSDTVVFDATSTNNATINTNVTVAGVSIYATYTGTITQAASQTLTVNGSYTQSGGTLTGGGGAITINGDFTLAGGIFTSTSGTFSLREGNGNIWTHTAGGTFNHNNGTVDMRVANPITTSTIIDVATSETFYNLKLGGFINNAAYSIDISSGDTLIVENTFTHTTGALNGGTIEVRGNMIVSNAGQDGAAIGTTTISFLVAGDQTITGNGGRTSTLNINKSSGTVSLGSTDIQINDFTLSSGTFISTSGTLTVGAFSNGNGDWTHTAGGTFSHNNGTVIISGYGTTINIFVTETFYNFKRDMAIGSDWNNDGVYVTIATGDTLIVENTFTHRDGTISGGTIEARGNVVIKPETDRGNVALTLSGSTANQIIESEGGTPPGGTWKIMKTAGVVTLSGSLSLNTSGQDLIVGSGALVLSGNTLTVNDVLEVGSQGTVQLRGNEVINATTKTLKAGSTVKFTGDGDGAADTYPVTNHFGASYKNLRIHSTDNATDTFTLTGALTVGGALSINSGSVLSLGGYNFTNTGGSYTSSGTLRLQGGETITNFTNDTDSGLTEYVGTSSYTGLAAGNSYYNLTFNGAGGTWTLNSALTANGSLTLSAGQLDVSASNYPVTVLGSWTDTASGDQFNPRSGRVVFSSGGTLNSNENFFSVEKTSGYTTTLATALSASGTLKVTGGTLSTNAKNV